jgi:hypothetical protein
MKVSEILNIQELNVKVRVIDIKLNLGFSPISREQQDGK